MESEADPSSPSSAEVKNARSYTSTVPYIPYMANSTFTVVIGLRLFEKVKVDKGPYH
jgi:hypothetical protein